MLALCQALWLPYFKKPLDTLPTNWEQILNKVLREYFFSSEWYEVYDFIEFVAQNFPYNRFNKKSFINTCNAVLERELSGFRFVGDTISPITNKAEIDMVDEALA